ncbi:serine hydrolase domain-containing protein [Henriciella sp. AS95]|uniref:serine hydrolase domain-containing protein n=1 Tax=Henriciella sp. AS95 TaxID=3135782 RepID=UPI003180FA9B
MLVRTIKTAALALSLVGCAVAQPVTPPTDAIAELVSQSQEAAPYPALAISVRKGDEILYEGAVGTADLEQDVPATPDTVFAIGSITKSFTAIAVATLAAEGKIDLNAPISTYIPDYDGPAGDAPVWTLMNHTSGILNYNAQPEFPQGTRKAFTQREMRDMFEAAPLMFEPGTNFSYSNSGIFLLGVIVENVTGKPYDTYLEETIFAPLGLERTYYNRPQTIIPHRASGYVLSEDGYQNAPILDPSVPFSAGALASTVQDLQAYVDGVHRQNLLGDDVRNTLYEMREFPDGEANPYALGALIIRNWEGHRKIAHAGDIDGFSGYMAFYPDEDLSIIVLANSRNVSPSPVGLEQKIARLVFDTPRGEPSSEPLTPAQQAILVGDYDVGRVRIGIDQIGILKQDDGLAMKFGGTASDGPAIPLVRLDGLHFYAANDDEMTFTFIPGEDDTPTRVMVDYVGGLFSFYKTN